MLNGGNHVNLIYPPREGASPADHALSEAPQVGAAAPPTDVDTTGSSSGDEPNSAEIDHRRAYSKGGETVDSNLDAACRTCNRSKGSKDLGTEWVPPKQRQP
jgi:hypothetical protein